jgi:RNA polymerase sigma-70 factor (ECF subfamily)
VARAPSSPAGPAGATAARPGAHASDGPTATEIFQPGAVKPHLKDVDGREGDRSRVSTLAERVTGAVPDVEADRADAERAVDGDTAAFERIYRRHVGRVHALCRRMIGPEEADDAAQEVFVRVWSRLDRFRGEAALGTWIHRVAVNVVLGRRKTLALRRTRFPETDPDRLPERPAAPRTELRMDFETAIARLPKGARDIFVLHDVEGYKHEEIAALLGVTTGTTKSQLHRARMMLRGHLG